jgi:hypothetical protein
MEKNSSNINIDKILNERIPSNYTKIVERPHFLSAEKFLKSDDTELILFEVPKNFDKSLLNKARIKNFGTNGKITRLAGNYQGICFDSTHPLPSQSFCVLQKKDKKSFLFKKFDRYVKVFEQVDIPIPTYENVIPRRLQIKKSLSKRKRKKSNI